MDFADDKDVPGRPAASAPDLERARLLAAVKFMGLSKPGNDHDLAEMMDAAGNRGLSPVLAKLRSLLSRAAGRH